jgi:hypothetical protein
LLVSVYLSNTPLFYCIYAQAKRSLAIFVSVDFSLDTTRLIPLSDHDRSMGGYSGGFVGITIVIVIFWHTFNVAER